MIVVLVVPVVVRTVASQGSFRAFGSARRTLKFLLEGMEYGVGPVYT
jgi:hypothetical protein